VPFRHIGRVGQLGSEVVLSLLAEVRKRKYLINGPNLVELGDPYSRDPHSLAVLSKYMLSKYRLKLI
jgi:hypothetical protein